MASHEEEQASSCSRITYKNFMRRHRKQFIECVAAEKIAQDLQLEEIIPDRKAYTGSKDHSVGELYFHMLEQGTVESLRKLYSICKQCKGYPQMNDFGNDMLKRFEKVDCDTASETVEPLPKKPTEDKSTSPTVTVKAITSPSGKGSCSTEPEEEEKEKPPKKKHEGENPESVGRVVSVVEFRHVVLLGKSGAGKSTVGNRILGLGTKNRPPGFEAGVSWDQVTRDIQTLQEDREFNGRTLRISVTDTIGLFNKKMGKGVLTKVREQVQKHCSHGITTVLFVLSKGRYLAVEQEVYNCIMKHCGTEDAKSMTALVITHCDGMDDKEKADSLERFKTGERTKELVDFVKLGIHLVGFPDFSTCDESSQRRQLEEALKDSIPADNDHLLRIVAENYKPKMVQQIMLKSWWEECALF